MNRILIFFVSVFGLCNALAQHYEIPTTPFTRSFLNAPDQATAQGLLGLGGGSGVWTASGSDIWFNNNVGIGAAPPDSRSRPDVTLYLNRSGFANAYINSGDDSQGAQFVFQQPDYNFVFGMRGDSYYGSNPGDFFLHSDSGGSTAFICTPDGKVGFGGEPSGAVQFTLADDTNPGLIYSWDNRHVVYGLPGGNGGGLGISYSAENSTIYHFYLVPGIAWQNSWEMANQYDFQLQGQANGVSTLTIMEDGAGYNTRVGINNNSPSSSYSLDVGGATHTGGNLNVGGAANVTAGATVGGTLTVGSSSVGSIVLGNVTVLYSNVDPPTATANNGSLALTANGTTGKMYLRTGGAWVQVTVP